MPRRPTMSDVARLAGGVHPSTVSLALRNDPSISEATRRRVHAAAEKIGYRPDPLLDAFNTHRKGVLPQKSVPVIAFVSDVPNRETFDATPRLVCYWEGARAAADVLHCKLELFLLNRGQLTPERLNSVLSARGIVSIVVAGLTPETTRLAFDWKDYSAVKIASHHLSEPSYSVKTDLRDSARLAWNRLRGLGYERIGMVCAADPSMSCAELYRVGFHQAELVQKARIPVLDLPAGSRPAVLARWIRQHKVDAVIGSGAAVEVLLEEASPAKDRPAFACLDVTGLPPRVAGVVPDYRRVGEEAIEQVVSLMRSNLRGLIDTPSCTYIPPSWRDGASAPAKGA